MFSKAMLICEDVRLETNGTVTLVGVHSERLFAPAGKGPLKVPRLRFVTIVGGLRGAEALRYRHQLRAIAERERFDLDWSTEKHDPASDEHNFIFGDDAFSFPGDGEFELITDVEAGGQQKSFRYRFEIVRAKR